MTRLPPRTRRAAVVAGLLAVVAAGAAAFVVSGLNKPSQSAINPLIQQMDGKYGYAMLRPASWTPLDMRDIGRGYRDAKNLTDARVLLIVRNISVSTVEGDMDAMLFARDRSLELFVADTERRWRHDHVEFVRLETLPNARIYATRMTGTTDAGDTVQTLDLLAYAVDQGQLLIVVLTGGAGHSLEPLDQLKAEGAIDGFITMVKSLRAIPVDPGNVSPPLD